MAAIKTLAAVIDLFRIHEKVAFAKVEWVHLLDPNTL